MDFKKVIKFNTLRAQLSTEEFTLAETLWDASDADKQLLVESLQPAAAQPAKKQQQRCTYLYERGVVCDCASRNIVHHNNAHVDFHQFTTVKVKKSARTQSLQQQLQVTQKMEVDGVVDKTCTAQVDDNGGLMPCGLRADDNIHHMSTTEGYHQFVAAETAAAGGD